MVKVYISGEPRKWLAEEVLRYSLLKRTKAKVEFVDLHYQYLPAELSAGLSFARYYIPYLEKYEGRVVFLEANTLVLDDIQKLYDSVLDKPALARSLDQNPALGLAHGYNTDVLLLDCSHLTHWKPAEWVNLVKEKPLILNNSVLGLPGSLPYNDFGVLSTDWNSMGDWVPETKILYYYDSALQPDSSNKHTYSQLFYKELADAILDQEISIKNITQEIHKGHIHPNFIDFFAPFLNR